MTEIFSVRQFFPDGSSEHVADLPAKESVELAKRLTESLGGRLGTTQRIIITDSGDTTVFEWRFGEGVVFPTAEEIAERGTREKHLAWAKQRALELLPEMPELAVSSFATDLTKHTETAQIALACGIEGTKKLLAGAGADEIRRWIEGIQ